MFNTVIRITSINYLIIILAEDKTKITVPYNILTITTRLHNFPSIVVKLTMKVKPVSLKE